MDPMIRIGVEVKTGRPVEVPLSVIRRHLWIQGRTGAGKTLLLCYLLCQILRADREASAVVDDLGGDFFLFNKIHEAANDTNRPFKFLSMGPRDAWSPLDMFRPFTPLTPDVVAPLVGFILTVFALEYGEGFPKSFWGRLNRSNIRRLVEKLLNEGIDRLTVEVLARALADTAKTINVRDISEAQLVADGLLGYAQLLPSDIPGEDIDPWEMLSNGGVAFGSLCAVADPGPVLIASILAWSFIFAAIQRHEEGLPRKQMYLAVDEFPLLAGSKQWAGLFTLARKFHITLIPLTQETSQTRDCIPPLFPILWGSCSCKIWLTPTDPFDIDMLRSLSKDVVQELGNSTTSVKRFQSSSSYSEVYQPKLLRNEILDAAGSGIGGSGIEGFLMLDDQKGHHDPIHFRFVPDWTLEEYERLANTPLPTRPTPIAARPTDYTVSDTPPKDREYDTRQAQLDALLQKKRDNEDWKGGK